MEVSRILHQMSKPVVAQLDGAAAGAGLSIALSCDLRIASESCKITTAFAKVGFSGDYGGTYFLTKMLGTAKARELYLMSPVLTAKEALGLNMVTKVVPDAEIEAAAHEVAMSLATGPSIALGYIKRNINNAETMSLEACFDGEAIHHSRAGETPTTRKRRRLSSRSASRCSGALARHRGVLPPPCRGRVGEGGDPPTRVARDLPAHRPLPRKGEGATATRLDLISLRDIRRLT